MFLCKTHLSFQTPSALWQEKYLQTLDDALQLQVLWYLLVNRISLFQHLSGKHKSSLFTKQWNRRQSKNRLKSQNNTAKRPGQMFAGVCKFVTYKCEMVIFNDKCSWDFVHLCMQTWKRKFMTILYFINMSCKQYPTRGLPSHTHTQNVCGIFPM